MRKLEVCCSNIESVRAAKEAGADRIELCTALETGGVTPSIGLIREAVNVFGKGVFVLIRERAGDFVYSPAELKVMKDDIRAAVKAGVSGVVIGALTPENEIDLEGLKFMMEAAEGVDVTFHRAFDETADPLKALESVIEAGCHRILTSGHAPTAPEGLSLLKELNDKAADRIIILAGSGVTSENAATILNESGCREIHGSAKEKYHGTFKSEVEEIRKIKNAIS